MHTLTTVTKKAQGVGFFLSAKLSSLLLQSRHTRLCLHLKFRGCSGFSPLCDWSAQSVCSRFFPPPLVSLSPFLLLSAQGRVIYDACAVINTSARAPIFGGCVQCASCQRQLVLTQSLYLLDSMLLAFRGDLKSLNTAAETAGGCLYELSEASWYERQWEGPTHTHTYTHTQQD